MVAQVSGSAVERVLATAAAWRTGIRPSQSRSKVPGMCWVSLRADARENEDDAGETLRARPSSRAAPLPWTAAGVPWFRSASRILCSARTCQMASIAASDDRR